MLDYWMEFYAWAGREPQFVQVAIGIVLASLALFAMYGLARVVRALLTRTLYALWSPHVTPAGFWLMVIVILCIVVGAYAVAHRLGYWPQIASWFGWLLGR